MNTTHYCKNCRAIIETEYGKETYICPDCGKEIAHKDLMRGWTLEARTNQLRAMHNMMCEANDENLYMSWIYLMPDGATEEDFLDIAFDDELYNECFDLFVKLVKNDDMRW